MNPRIKLLFVVGTALTIGRALDLGLWTDLESGLCAVGPVWLRYAALAVGALAAICIGRKLAHGPQELRNRCKASGIVTAMAGAFFTAAGFLRFAVGMTGAGSFVRAILEILCGQWLAQLAKSWLRKDWQPPTKSMASGIWGTLVIYWSVLSRFMENSSSWHRVSPTVMVWEMLAVLLFLSALAGGGEVIASRGELVEIGGSFRIPEIVTQCGCKLCEVGATNKTHRRDYEAAIGEQKRALLKVHTSNYRIVGFTESVPREELAEIAHGHGLPLIEDLGSGAIVDLEPFGIRGEPTVQRSLHAGVDVASFSGDKLLGGPQAGLIVGKREYIERLKKHPLARALRLDKMTLAALHATLSAYLDAEIAVREIPTLAMLSASEDELHAKALRLQKALADTGGPSLLVWTGDAGGGGSAPAQELTGWAVAIEPGRLSVDELEEKLRLRAKPIVARIHRRQYLLCVRTMREEDFAEIAAAAAEAIR